MKKRWANKIKVRLYLQDGSFQEKSHTDCIGTTEISLGSMNSQSISEACSKIRTIHQILRIQRV